MFRSGEPARLIVNYEGQRNIALLQNPTMHSLRSTVAAVIPTLTEFDGLCFYVKRDGIEFALEDERDLEELGGILKLAHERENVYVIKKSIVQRPGLRQFPLKRDMIPALFNISKQVPIFVEGERKHGSEMMEALRKHSFFKIKLRKETLECIEETFKATIDFFENESPETKMKYAGSTTSRLAPNFGYRATSLQKEYFVFRNTTTLSDSLPGKLVSLKKGFDSMCSVLRQCMEDMLCGSLDWSEEKACAALSNALDPIDVAANEKHIKSSSFTEVFKYDCTTNISFGDGVDRYKVLCSEHRDTSLLTMIPKFKGSEGGLEAFDWSTGQWHCIENDLEEDEAIVFPGELFSPYCQTDVPACNHRVIVRLSENGKRYSCPTELLPYPTPETWTMLSELGKNLVSVNY